jgi:tetratricopeptide (TPR) repeat protein
MDRRGALARPADFATLESAPAGADAVRRALADRRLADAAGAYFALPPGAAQGALDADQAVELASWLRNNGHSEAALTLLRRVVREVPHGSRLAEVYAATGLLLLEDRREPTAAYQYLLTALELDPRPETEAAVRRALQDIDVLQKRRVGRPHSPRPW